MASGRVDALDTLRTTNQALAASNVAKKQNREAVGTRCCRRVATASRFEESSLSQRIFSVSNTGSQLRARRRRMTRTVNPASPRRATSSPSLSPVFPATEPPVCTVAPFPGVDDAVGGAVEAEGVDEVGCWDVGVGGVVGGVAVMGLVRMTAAVSSLPIVTVARSNVSSPQVPPATTAGVSSVRVTTAPKGIASQGETAWPSFFTVGVQGGSRDNVMRVASYPRRGMPRPGIEELSDLPYQPFGAFSGRCNTWFSCPSSRSHVFGSRVSAALGRGWPGAATSWISV